MNLRELPARAASPVTGNLTSRQDFLKNKTENFTYDNLDRLTTVAGPQILTMDYAANGNMIQKSDMGNQFTYGNTAKPYQLIQMETASGLVSDVLQDIAYTSFEQPATIAEAPYLATFAYNSESQRAKMEVSQNGSAILIRWYAGNSYIKETAGGVTKEYTWIGGDAYSAPCLAIKQGGATTWYYLLRDHLGTITHVTDASGNIVNEYNFDAWGRRRNFTDWSYNVADQIDILPDRGFTGHEYLPWFKLYNMNGRLYDPVVGRFLEPDPVVQDASSTQSLNRYSYCLNNPLKYTDPSGYKMTFAPGETDFWINPTYKNPNGGRGTGNSKSSYGGPGFGDNGPGSNGIYYDWYSNSHRSTSEGNPAVGWKYAYNIASNSGASTNSSVAIEAILGSVVNDGFNFGIHRAFGRNHIVIWPYAQKLNVGYSLNGGLTSTNGTVFSGGNIPSGGGANAWDYISNGASVASGYPTISGTWAYNTSGDVAWTGKNGNYYKLSQVKNNGGYVKSMNYAKNASRLTRGLGNGLTGLSVFASGVSSYIAVSNGTDNTSTWVNLGISVGGAALTIFGAPVVVTGAAIGGAVWGIGQLVAGDEINGWIDNNFGY